MLLLLIVAASLPLHAQRMDLAPSQAAEDNAAPDSQTEQENPSTSSTDSEEESNPAVAVEPGWVTSWDSDGNRRQRIKAGSDLAVGDHARLGLLFGQAFIYNTLPKANVPSEAIRDAEVTGRWQPNKVVKLDGMFGASQTGASVGTGGQPLQAATIPITNVLAHLTPPGGVVKVDLGFNRSIFDLSPQLVANQVVKNQFVIHPEIALPSGWRMRALAEMGPMTSPGESNARYNSEFTVGRKLGKESELYSTYSLLHYAKPSNAGYNPPDLAENIEGGWSTDLDRSTVSLSLDFGLGAGHAKQHGEIFGPWGLSGHAESDLTWTIRPGRELRTSYEFSYDKSNPAVQSPSSAAWRMGVLTVSFRWAISTPGHHPGDAQ